MINFPMLVQMKNKTPSADSQVRVYSDGADAIKETRAPFAKKPSFSPEIETSEPLETATLKDKFAYAAIQERYNL